MKIISGHQPVYLPWLGLIHKASLADIFIFMDDVQYLSQDWNNRNRIKSPQGKPIWLTVPLNIKESKSLILKDILISEEDNLPERKRWQNIHWSSIQMAYGKCQYFNKYRGFFEWLYLENDWRNLADLNLAILKQIFCWFGLTAVIVLASQENFAQKKSDLVIEHAQKFNADIVVTGIHGQDYMDFAHAEGLGIKVIIQDYNHPEYDQRFGQFVSHLSFVDLLFNHGPHSLEIYLENNLAKSAICNSIE